MSAHSRHSTLREVILEHAFIADLLKRLWARGTHDVEVLRSEFDAGGYDLVISQASAIRHIQLKAKRRAGRTRQVKIADRLALRAAGCVIVFVVDDDLNVDHYLWFGAAAGRPLPDTSMLRTARHTKGDASGYKAERPDHKILPLSRCERLDTLDEVIKRLLGSDP